MSGYQVSITDPSAELRDWRTCRKREPISSYLMGADARKQALQRIYFLGLINLHPGDRVIDCGANVGDFWLAISDVQPEVEYIAFEPSAEEFEALKSNVTQAKLNNLALWKQDGPLAFYLSPEGADSSAIQPKTYEKTVALSGVRLEPWLKEKKVGLLKLEAEGAELEVLQGCGELLSNVSYITADLGPERGVASANTLPEVVNFLLDKGFAIEAFSNERVTVLFRNKSQPDIN